MQRTHQCSAINGMKWSPKTTPKQYGYRKWIALALIVGAVWNIQSTMAWNRAVDELKVVEDHGRLLGMMDMESGAELLPPPVFK